jgi:hypothetical protein
MTAQDERIRIYGCEGERHDHEHDGNGDNQGEDIQRKRGERREGDSDGMRG